MATDLWSLYGLMYKSRAFEEAVRQIWKDGKISGEMHLGMGEEAIVAGIVSQLIEGDALALEHRGTPPMLMRGVDPVALLREFMAHKDGLCGGMADTCTCLLRINWRLPLELSARRDRRGQVSRWPPKCSDPAQYPLRFLAMEPPALAC